MPFFSVIMPAYNRGPLIGAAIDSVLRQVFGDWELIVIDDASSDNTGHIVKAYSDGRIRYHRNQQNMERSASRNLGVEMAAGHYICFLDSDDEYLPVHLLEMHKEIEKQGFPKAVLFSEHIYNNKPDKERTHSKLSFDQGEPLLDFLALNTITSQQVCVHRSLLEKESYDENMNVSEDRELWMRLAGHAPFFHVDKPTVMINEHERRTVNHANTASYIKNKRATTMLARRYRSLKRETKRTMLNLARYALIRSYMLNKRRNAAYWAALRQLMADPGWRTREMVYLLLRNCLLTRPFVKEEH